VRTRIAGAVPIALGVALSTQIRPNEGGRVRGETDVAARLRINPVCVAAYTTSSRAKRQLLCWSSTGGALRHEAPYNRVGCVARALGHATSGRSWGSPMFEVRRRAGATPRCSCASRGRSAAARPGRPQGLTRRLSRAARGGVFGRSRSPPPVSGLRACPKCAARGFGRSRAGPPARWRSPSGRRRWPSGRVPPVRVN
jgi:hypothetical protein